MDFGRNILGGIKNKYGNTNKTTIKRKDSRFRRKSKGVKGRMKTLNKFKPSIEGNNAEKHIGCVFVLTRR